MLLRSPVFLCTKFSNFRLVKSISMAELSNSVLNLSNINNHGKLALSLKEALDTVVAKTLREIKFSMIRNSYGEIFHENPDSLRKLHDEIISQLKENIKLEISKICKDENIDILLNSLDDIILENAENIGKVAWRPSGNPQEDLRDHLFNSKLKQKEDLESILKELDEENEVLLNTVKKNHQEITQAKLEIDKISYGFTKAVNMLETRFIDFEKNVLFSTDTLPLK